MYTILFRRYFSFQVCLLLINMVPRNCVRLCILNGGLAFFVSFLKIYSTVYYNSVQLYYLFVEKFAFWFIIYIKHSMHCTIKHQQFYKHGAKNHSDTKAKYLTMYAHTHAHFFFINAVYFCLHTHFDFDFLVNFFVLISQ